MGLQYSSIVNAPLDEVFAWHERRGALPASSRRGSRSRSHRKRRPWSTVKRSCACLDVCAGSHSTPMTIRRAGSWTNSSRCRSIGGTRTPSRRSVTTRPVSSTTSTRPSRARSCCRPFATGTSNSPTTWPRMRERMDDQLTVAVTGSSGLIGSALCAYLTTGGHNVVRLVRRQPSGPWSDAGSRSDPTPLPSRVSMRSSISPERPSPAVSPLRTSGTSRQPRGPDGCAGSRHGRLGRRTAPARVRVSDRLLRCRSRGRGADRGERRGSGFLADLVADWEAAANPAARRRCAGRACAAPALCSPPGAPA